MTFCNFFSGSASAQEIRRSKIEGFITSQFCTHVKRLLHANFGQRRFFTQARFTFGMTKYKDNLAFSRHGLVNITDIVESVRVGNHGQIGNSRIAIDRNLRGRFPRSRRSIRIHHRVLDSRIHNRRILSRVFRIGNRLSRGVRCRVCSRVCYRICNRSCRGRISRIYHRSRINRSLCRIGRIVTTASNNNRNKSGANHGESLAGYKLFHIHRFFLWFIIYPPNLTICSAQNP